MRKRTKYVRASDGKFAKVSGGGKKAPVIKGTTKKGTKVTATKSRRSRKDLVKRIKKRTGLAKVTLKQTRAERNRLALKKLKAAGVKVPKGTLKRITNLKKGGSVKLPGGATISRSKNDTYTVKRKKK